MWGPGWQGSAGTRLVRLLGSIVLLGAGWVAGTGSAASARPGPAGALIPGTAGTVSSDFNGDGFPDLAVGLPFEDTPLRKDAGAVNILYSTAAGPQAVSPDDQFWTQDSPDVEDQVEGDDRFGYALATADFNGDGFADLASGVTLEGTDTVFHAGGVNVLYGSVGGIQATDPVDQFWTQDSPDVDDDAEEDDRMGRSVAAADFNGDGFADLAFGSPFEKVGAQTTNAGGVNVLYGSAGGLQTADPPDQFWTQDSPGIKDVAEKQDRFAWSLAADDFNGDGFADLAVGVDSEDFGTRRDVGAVNVIYGSATGLQAFAPDDQFWSQDSPDVEDDSEPFDRMGWFMGTGDFNADGFADLATGAPYDDAGGVKGSGAVNVLYGSAVGLQATDPVDQYWFQNTPGVEDLAEPQDWFGWAVVGGDFNGDGFDDLAVGSRVEDTDTVVDAGSVNVLYGSVGGLQTADPPDQFWTQDSTDVEGDAAEDDEFGWSLFSEDFNADGFSDLVVGVPLEEVDTIGDAGAFNVLFGGIDGVQVVSPADQLWTQDSPDVQDQAELDDKFGFVFVVGGQCTPPCHRDLIGTRGRRG